MFILKKSDQQAKSNPNIKVRENVEYTCKTTQIQQSKEKAFIT